MRTKPFQSSLYVKFGGAKPGWFPSMLAPVGVFPCPVSESWHAERGTVDQPVSFRGLRIFNREKEGGHK